MDAVSVCICTRDRPDDLARVLESIGRSTLPPAEVIVSDDLHDDRTENVCRKAPVEVTYVHGPARGLGANRNRALAGVTGNLVLFLDDDCLLGRDYLARGVAHLRDAEARHGHGRVIVTGRELNHGRLVGPAEQTFLGFQARRYTRPEGLRTIVINATLFPAQLFESLRFDPQLVYGYEEVDLATRAAAAGYQIVTCPDAINDHRPSPRSREDHDRHLEASRLHVTLRRYALTERRPIKAAAFALIAPAHVFAADLKRSGVAGVGRSVRTMLLAATMLWRAGGGR